MARCGEFKGKAFSKVLEFGPNRLEIKESPQQKNPMDAGGTLGLS